MKASMTQKNPNVDEVFEIDNKFHDMIADMGHNAMVLKINAITRVLTHSTRYYSVKGMLESGLVKNCMKRMKRYIICWNADRRMAYTSPLQARIF